VRKFWCTVAWFQPVGSGHGIIAACLGMMDQDVVTLLRGKRPGALFNENFAAYLTALPPDTTALGLSWNLT
jgi:hypothetical protein